MQFCERRDLGADKVRKWRANRKEKRSFWHESWDKECLSKHKRSISDEKWITLGIFGGCKLVTLESRTKLRSLQRNIHQKQRRVFCPWRISSTTGNKVKRFIDSTYRLDYRFLIYGPQPSPFFLCPFKAYPKQIVTGDECAVDGIGSRWNWVNK